MTVDTVRKGERLILTVLRIENQQFGSFGFSCVGDT